MGMAAKIRPALALTPEPADNELALVTLVSHTTAEHPGNPWFLTIAKSWLKPGAFNLQNVGTFPTAKFIRRLGSLTETEYGLVKSKLKERLGI